MCVCVEGGGGGGGVQCRNIRHDKCEHKKTRIPMLVYIVFPLSIQTSQFALS